MNKEAARGAAGGDTRLQLWGGHECTVNRVRDAWFDQTIRAGHEDRADDLALFAELGISKLRYPVLWERVSPETPDGRDFGWSDARLEEIRRLGMEPIVTLCHHGSGPRYTSLVEHSFATGLARHAEAVAARYPWVTDYTPVNEPLTTARFSALYGFWYPHQRDEGAFWLALLNEIDATRLSMRAIRRINPAARLIQTDDLGFCHATAPLKGEADFQNERRWMGWDLLCGRVVPGHALWGRLADFGLGDRLRRIADDPCPPDVIGVNHYLSSERLLDHRVELHGGRGLADRDLGTCNGVQHVDVDAARSVPEQVVGLAGLLEQTWQRYGLPIAVTEVHNGSTRDEQARWFIDAWDTAEVLRERGVDVRALTAWSLLGSYDWNRMVTRSAGHYEPGIFDLRGGAPRPTLMARVLKDLAQGRRPHGPGLDVPGWWREERRAFAATPDAGFATGARPRAMPHPAPLAILAGEIELTAAIASACEVRGLHHMVVDASARASLAAARPWAILDARIAGADAAVELAAFCESHGIAGAVIRPHEAGDAASAVPDTLLVAETAPLFFADGVGVEGEILDALDAGDQVIADARRDWYASYAPSVVDGVLDLLLDGARGVAAFVPEAGWSEADVARALATVAGHEPCCVREEGAGGLVVSLEEPVPSYLPCLETMLERFVHDRRWRREAKLDQVDLLLEAAE